MLLTTDDFVDLVLEITNDVKCDHFVGYLQFLQLCNLKMALTPEGAIVIMNFSEN